MIKNASNYNLDQNAGTLPNMQDAMLDWFQKLSFIQIVKSIVNGNLVETETEVTFMGVRQPMTAEQLSIKPEGERSWKWETIHAFPDLVLNTDDRIIFGGTKYRVMNKSNYTEYGYVEYQIVQDFEP